MVWRDKDHVLAYHPTSIGGLVGVGGIYVGLPKRLGKILEGRESAYQSSRLIPSSLMQSCINLVWVDGM